MTPIPFKVGDRVRAERDEGKYPSRGSWPRYRGKEGVVVALNRRDGEIGVTFTRMGNVDLARVNADSWFLPHELVLVDSNVSPNAGASGTHGGPTGADGPQIGSTGL